MFNSTLKRVSATSALALFVSLAATQAAFADPAGCSVSTPTMTISGSGLLSSSGAASCNTALSRVFVGEVKYQKTFSPDPLTLKSSTGNRTSKSYTLTVSGCDDGNAHPYYGRSYFSNFVTYHDSATVDARSCQ